MDPTVKQRVDALLEEAAALRMFGHLVGQGTPILESLLYLADFWPKMAPVFQAIHSGIRDGETIRNCLNDHLASFQNFVPSLMDIGQETGELDTVLLYCADLISEMATVITRNGTVDEAEIKVTKMLDYYMLGTLLEAGLPIFRSVQILAETSSSLKVPAWKDVLITMEQGETLPEAMSRHFPTNLTRRLAVVKKEDVGSTRSEIGQICKEFAEEEKRRIFAF